MQVSDLQRLFDYSYWATKKLLAVVSQLTPEQYTQHVAGSYSSVRNTLVHVLSAEWGWLDRCGGPPRGPKLNADDYPTVESLVDLWTKVEGDMRVFLATLSEADVARDVEFALGNEPKRAIPLGELLHHAAIHAAHHRGQVALLLRELGVAPGNFDFLIFAGDHRAVAP